MHTVRGSPFYLKSRPHSNFSRIICAYDLSDKRRRWALLSLFRATISTPQLYTRKIPSITMEKVSCSELTLIVSTLVSG